jgi:hypothetical protein
MLPSIRFYTNSARVLLHKLVCFVNLCDFVLFDSVNLLYDFYVMSNLVLLACFIICMMSFHNCSTNYTTY